MHWVVIHQYHIRSFNGSVRTHSAHSYADVCPAKHRGVVDAITHKSQFFFLRLVLDQLLHFLHLVGRKQFTVNLIQPQCRGYTVSHLLGVTRKHHGLADTRRFQRLDSPLGVGFYNVGNYNVPGIFAVNRHVNDRPHTMARNSLDAQTIHELVVSGRHLMAVHRCNHAVAAELLNIGYTAAVDFHTVGFL